MYSISSGSFTNNHPDFKLWVYAHSYAHTWAEKNGVAYELYDPENAAFTFTESGNKITITGYTGTATLVEIPETLLGYPVVAIGENCFKDNRELRSVTIPATVTTIGDYAFSGCVSLGNVKLPDGLTRIGRYAFADCQSFTSIELPDSLDANTNKGVNPIGSYAFSGCIALESINIPDGVTKITYGMLSGCRALKRIDLPAGVTEIEGAAFQDCSSLTSIVIPEGVKAIAPYMFNDCEALTSVVIPDSVTEIGNNAFDDCAALTRVDIPAGVTAIGYQAFSDCAALQNVVIPENVIAIELATFRRCTSLTEVVIPERVATIDQNAFSDCSSLTCIDIPAGVTYIGEYAFARSGLERIIFRGTDMPAVHDTSFHAVQPTVYCYEFSGADFWAEENGFEIVYLDNVDLTLPIAITLPADCEMWTGAEMAVHAAIFPELKDAVLTWTSSDEAVAVIADGVLTAVGPGEATITVACGGVSDEMVISVRMGVDSFELTKDEIHLVSKETHQLKIIGLEPEETDVSFTWTSADQTIAKVDENGLVSALKPGSTRVTATSANGVSRDCAVNVYYPVEQIDFEPAALKLALGEEAKLRTVIFTRDTMVINQLITFSSSDESVVACTADGRVQAVGLGTAEVTAAAANGKSASCTITVSQPCEVHQEAELIEIEPSCTTDGLTAGRYCSVCGMVLVEQEVIPALGHHLIPREGQKPTFTEPGWEPNEECTQCGYTSWVDIPALGERPIASFDDLVNSLSWLETWAVEYAAETGADPIALVIRYISAGVDSFNTGYWGNRTGGEDADFAAYVHEQEEAYNAQYDSVEDLICVRSLKNLEIMTLPNGEMADMGHLFGVMDVTYSNAGKLNDADAAGWAGGLVNLLCAVDHEDQQALIQGCGGDVDEMADVIRKQLLGKDLGYAYDLSRTELYANLDGFCIMENLGAADYEAGNLASLFRSYFTRSLTEKDRAAYLMEYRLNGLVGRIELREAVYNAYGSNSTIADLEGTHEFNNADLTPVRQAVCYAFADYLCSLAGDWVGIGENPFMEDVEVAITQLAPGVSMEIHKALTSDNLPMVYYLGYADLSREGVTVMANYHSRDPEEWGLAPVVEQASAAQAFHSNPEDENYIANLTPLLAINGGSFVVSTGKPAGLLTMHGVVYNGMGNGDGFFGIRTDGTAVLGTVNEYWAVRDSLAEGIGGFGAMLINDGVIRYASPNAEEFAAERTSRTAVGITQSGRVVFMALDGRQSDWSYGGSVYEAAMIMKNAGCVDAILLGGGGQTTFAARQEGADTLSVVNRPSDGSAAAVATSLMVVSTEHEWAYGVITVQPTAETAGQIQYTCVHCGATKMESVELGVIGDPSGDGMVDMQDVVLLLDWFCDGPVELNLANGDVNGDGMIDMQDIATLYIRMMKNEVIE